jgi:hypothetical protein
MMHGESNKRTWMYLIREKISKNAFTNEGHVFVYVYRAVTGCFE